ncbi:hypothetical protein HK101_004238 [Irineochytrium annulatum]|nr:hypothetical protein HK101_004238 [Irineochytrium annulatum]
MPLTWGDVEASAVNKTTADAVKDSGSAYVVIHGKVYNLAGDFIRWHPGGDVVVAHLGKDASTAFDALHSDDAKTLMADYYVDDLVPTPSTKEDRPVVPTKLFSWREIEASAFKKTTIADVEKGGPAYIVIHGKVYNVGGNFLRWHPGGAVAISQLGKDASGAFEVFHSPSSHAVLSQYYVGDLDPAEALPVNGFAMELETLKATIKKMGVYKSNKFYYLFKICSTLSILSFAIFVLLQFPNNSFAVITSAIVLALFWQQCGWLAHDFLHHQVFEFRPYNDAFGYFLGNVAQGFSVHWWKNKHSTHHSVPNVHLGDPDIDTMPYLAWSEHALEFFSDLKDADVARFMVAYQPILYFPILAFARLAWAFGSIEYVTSGKVLNANSTLVEKVTLGIHWTWYLSVAFFLCTPLRALLFIFVSQTAAGVLLALVFSVNHSGMPVYSGKNASKINFYELQIVTGRDVMSSPLVDWFTGGLNFQIEHHMFPTIPRHQFYRVQPLVEALCKKHNVPYHRTSFWTASKLKYSKNA